MAAMPDFAPIAPPFGPAGAGFAPYPGPIAGPGSRGIQGKETMIQERTETKGAGGKRRPGLPPRARRERPGEAPQPEIDLDRLVWDPEYRDEIRRRLNRHA